MTTEHEIQCTICNLIAVQTCDDCGMSFCESHLEPSEHNCTEEEE